MRRVTLAVVVAGLAITACVADGEGTAPSATSEPVPRDDASDELRQLDRRWDEYQGHRTRMATGDLVSTSSQACGLESDCPLGFDVDGWYYVVEDTRLTDAIVGEALVELGDGSTAHVVPGAEPAVYLARVAGERRELLVADSPTLATTRERTLELRVDRCSILGVLDLPVDLPVGPFGCGDPAVRWLVGVEPDRWEADDQAQLSDPRIWRTEPLDPAAGQIVGPEGAVLGPFDDPIAQLGVALDRQCERFEPTQCRVGYSIHEQSADRVAATFVRQNVAEGSDVAYETTYLGVVLERLADGGWWSTESGPSAIHQNGVGSSGLDDADTRFAGCCDGVAGLLIAP